MIGRNSPTISLGSLMAILSLVPLCGLCVALVLILNHLYDRYHDANTTRHVIHLIEHFDQVAHQHAVERGLTAGFLGSKGRRLKDEVMSQRRKADAAHENLSTYLVQVQDHLPQQLLVAASEQLLSLLAQKQERRRVIDLLEPNAGSFGYYSAVNRAALEGIQTAMLSLDDGELAHEVEGLRLLLWLKERAGQARGAMNGAYAKRAVSSQVFAQINYYLIEIDQLQESMDRRMPEIWLSDFHQIKQQGIWQQVAEIEIDFIQQTNLQQVTGPNAGTWFALATQRIKLIKQNADQLSGFLINKSSTNASTYQQWFWLTLLVCLALVFVILTLALLSITSLKQRVLNIKSVLVQAATTKNLSGRTLEQKEDEIGFIGQAIDQMLDEISTVLNRVVEISENTHQTTEQIGQTSNQMSQLTTQSHSQTDQIASAMTELAQSAQEVAGLTENTQAIACSVEQKGELSQQKNSQAELAIESLMQTLQSSSKVVDTLAKNSSEVGEILDTISGISDQTNLLALNAAIEAARAGEQGRGFAVVADEVRTLATKTQLATEEIRNMIGSVKASAEQAIEQMDLSVKQSRTTHELFGESTAALAPLLNDIQQVKSMNQQVSAAAEEQSCVAQEINERVMEAVNCSNQTLSMVLDTQTVAERLSTQGLSLSEKVAEFHLQTH